MINQFRGNYRFLSNFYPSPIMYNNVLYPTNEHFFQAMKTMDQEARVKISTSLTPGIAKWRGSLKGYKGFKIVLRSDWEDIRITVMAFGLREKFKDPVLRQKLVATYPHALVEGNYWNDTTWGFCLKTNVGNNYLGQLLMSLRLLIINDQLLAGPDPVF